MDTTIRMKRLCCLSACLVISILCCKWLISNNNEVLENRSLDELIAERSQILDELDDLNFRIDTVQSQLRELEDSLIKKNERLGVIEGQLSNLR